MALSHKGELEEGALYNKITFLKLLVHTKVIHMQMHQAFNLDWQSLCIIGVVKGKVPGA